MFCPAAECGDGNLIYYRYPVNWCLVYFVLEHSSIFCCHFCNWILSRLSGAIAGSIRVGWPIPPPLFVILSWRAFPIQFRFYPCAIHRSRQGTQDPAPQLGPFHHQSAPLLMSRWLFYCYLNLTILNHPLHWNTALFCEYKPCVSVIPQGETLTAGAGAWKLGQKTALQQLAQSL